MHDPLLVDAADANVLENLLVDLPHLRRLSNEVIAVEGRRQQSVEFGRLRLHRRIGIKLEGYQSAGFIPDVGEISVGLIVCDPELVDYRVPDGRF